MEDLICPYCKVEKLILKDGMYALRSGHTFPGLVCEKCNTLVSENCPGFKAFIEQSKENYKNNQ